MEKQKYGIIEALEGQHFDVGLSGVWFGANYGSVITYYALYQTLQKLGYSVLMIDKVTNVDQDIERDDQLHSRRFARTHYKAIAPSLPMERMKDLNPYCHTFLMGCDQVWNYGIARNFGFQFYLDYVEPEKKKLSYASSFGHPMSFTPKEALSQVTRYLQRFDQISVREESAVTVLKNEFGAEAVQVLDPVFLLNEGEYDTLLREAKVREPEKYLLSYILDWTPEKRKTLEYAAAQKNLKLINLMDGRHGNVEDEQVRGLENTYVAENTQDWLWYFRHADFVITDSCHGTSFALLFEKPFVSMGNRKRGLARFESLVDLFQVRDRLILEPEQLMEQPALLSEMDFTQFRKILAMEKARSLKWLREALKSRKKQWKDIRCVPRKECCGCKACSNACPTEAISMVEDEEGFWYPQVDEQQCVNCGKCKEVCPSLHPRYNLDAEPVCYGAYGSDLVRKDSSSGGIFTLAAREILGENGAVCGAAFDESFHLKHRIIWKEEQLAPLKGSKYLQSDTGNTYQETKEILESGKSVLYVGCPCQIAGLRSYLKKDYEKLYTIDLLCHGGPSPKTFRTYLKEVHGEKNVSYVGFRDKDYFGWSTHMTVKYEDGSVYRKLRSEDLFYRAFLPCLSVRPHCQVCNYARLPRQGDLTLGDFWGVAKYDPEMTDEKGTSIVSVNSEQGKRLFQRIQGELLLWKEIDRNYVLTHGQPYARPFQNNARRYRFHRMSENCSLAKTLECCEQNHFDYGLLGLNGDSYGRILEDYALYQAASRMGYSILLVKRPKEKGKEVTPLSYRMVNFANRYYPTVSAQDRVDKMQALKGTCDSFLVGTAYEGMKEDFLEDNRSLVDYGEYRRNEGGVSPLHLLETEDYRRLIRHSKLWTGEPEEVRLPILVWSCKGSDAWVEARKYAQKEQLKLVDLTIDMPVEDWLYYICYGDTIFTDDRSVMDLACIFHKKVIPMEEKFRGYLRDSMGLRYPENERIQEAFQWLEHTLKKQRREDLRGVAAIARQKTTLFRKIKEKTPTKIKETLGPWVKKTGLYRYLRDDV